MGAFSDRSDADGGFTLTETLVVTILFAVVGTIVTVASVSGLHHQRQLQDRSDTIAAARTALERIDRDIRSAYPLLSVTSTRLVLREVQSSVTQTMTYELGGGQLSVTEVDTTASGTSSSTTTVLLHDLVNTTSNPLFAVAPIPGYVAPSGSGVTASTCAMSGGYDPGCVGTITVHLMVQPSTLAAPVSISDNGTDLRNTQ